MTTTTEIPLRPVDRVFSGRREAIKAATCIGPPLGCGKPAAEFSDAASLREFYISGFCQKCQDRVFG